MTLSNQRIDINLSWAGGAGCDGRECDRIRELLKGVDLSGFPVMFEIETLCSAHFFSSPSDVAAVVYLRMFARDREVPGKVARVEIAVSVKADLTDLAILELVKGKLLELVTHELLEQFIVKGDRVFDPHAEDERRRQRARDDEAFRRATQEFAQLPPEPPTRLPKPPSYYSFSDVTLNGRALPGDIKFEISFDKRTLIRQQKPRR